MIRHSRPQELLVLVASSFTAGLLLGLSIAYQPAEASDNGTRPQQKISDDAPLPPTAGCNPYIVIHPPDLPPDASNMNGVTIRLDIGDICGHWQAEPHVIPVPPAPRA